MSGSQGGYGAQGGYGGGYGYGQGMQPGQLNGGNSRGVMGQQGFYGNRPMPQGQGGDYFSRGPFGQGGFYGNQPVSGRGYSLTDGLGGPNVPTPGVPDTSSGGLSGQNPIADPFSESSDPAGMSQQPMLPYATGAQAPGLQGYGYTGRSPQPFGPGNPMYDLMNSGGRNRGIN